MILYVNGCSHSQDLFGCVENESKNFVWNRIFMEKLSDEYSYTRFDFDRLINRYEPKEFIYESNKDLLINDALDGASNDYIFHTTVKNISNLIRRGLTPDYVVIQFSGPNRRYTYDGSDYRFISPRDSHHLQHLMLFEPVASQHTLVYILTLQQILKQWNIKYKFFLFFELEKAEHTSSIISYIDMENIINLTDSNVFDGILQYMRENRYTRDELGHPNEFGAEFIAEKVYNSFFTR